MQVLINNTGQIYWPTSESEMKMQQAKIIHRTDGTLLHWFRCGLLDSDICWWRENHNGNLTYSDHMQKLAGCIGLMDQVFCEPVSVFPIMSIEKYKGEYCRYWNSCVFFVKLWRFSEIPLPISWQHPDIRKFWPSNTNVTEIVLNHL